MTNGGSDRIDEELVCIESLVHYLKENQGYQEIHIQREFNDPPDFWLTISGEKFAAEVTSIVTDYSYDALCHKLGDAIRRDCELNNYLKGKFLCFFLLQ